MSMARTLVHSRRDSDAFSIALMLAIGLHAVIITQLHFKGFDLDRDDSAPSLDVILVDSASERPPEEADFLAQANQIGGGDSEEAERPTDLPLPEPPIESDTGADFEPSAPAEAVAAESLPELVAPEAEQELPNRVDPEPVETEPLPTASELLRQARALAQTAPDPMAYERVLPKRPRRKFVTANTREHLYAAYMRAWVAKVERVGNMNYPEQARRRNLEGSLVLSVDVLPDGSIERVQILRSSGYEMLDEAAVRIVRLAAPYAELPPDIRAETDILTITRTWQFSARRGLN
ncbi:MAG: energy transducer TonB [Gammaproteobacteria bacterium HGW-Gammaproteobacteria-8]|nr:MAG: energy transducer TonB [Gammaproteobacteria bacterium HGW-Gammaproteobacteria-8]